MKKGKKNVKRNGVVTNKDLSCQIELVATNVHELTERVGKIEDTMVTKADFKDGLVGIEERLGSKINALDRRMDEFAVQYVKKEHHTRLAEKVSRLEHKI